jgi:hypothetical protein
MNHLFKVVIFLPFYKAFIPGPDKISRNEQSCLASAWEKYIQNTIEIGNNFFMFAADL